jgi:hypothetical protein
MNKPSSQYLSCIAASCVLLLASYASGAIDDFNPADYTAGSINAQSGGTGWQGAWGGNGNIRFSSTTGLHFRTPGYVNTPAGQGSMEMDQGLAATVQRRFAPAAIRSGEVWLSWIGNRLSNNSSSDRLGVALGDGTRQIYIGNRANDFGIGNAHGLINLSEAPDLFTAGENHLVVIKIDLDRGQIAAWLNPGDVSTERNLGTPTAQADPETLGFRLSELDGSILVFLSENSDQRISFDALRIGMTLEQVTRP